jgi:hypothetical protein
MPLIAESAALRELSAPTRRDASMPTTGRPALAVAASPPPVCPDPGQVLTDRGSVRQFANRPISAALLADAYRNAMRVERAYWSPGGHGDARLGLAVSAGHVEGLATGIHTFSAATAEFNYLAGPELVKELRLEYADSPALVLVYADRDRDLPVHSGYQNTLVRAGALGYAVLLNAMAAGLRGCPFGRAMSEVSTAVSAGESKPVLHLFTLAIGWPAEAGSAQQETG